MQLKGKTAVITGASSGIGEATALHLAREGAAVVLAARREDRLAALAEKVRAETDVRVMAVPTDVTNREEVESMIRRAEEELGSVDILVNNAGVMLLSFLDKGKVEEWERMVDVNIKGVLFGVHSVLPGMLKRGGGHIVNVSSVAGHEVFPSSSVYSATKYAVRAFSMGLEKELSRSGIRVTNISPGAVATELTQHITDPDVTDMFAKQKLTPLESEDIARSITYAVTQPENVNVNEVIVRPTNRKK
ncbi:NADP-dependent 3-hydroxy acid dehydrogenase YdfG [Melghirimyces profundicolus]|uniref:NADP-dependent 3-hydroxy acid dehydrogenase YdfG n=1 Tax=Melghirimyces profundicolus TaxID=1242148 RepID=A0A2T6BCV0_9BACL|nr:SDR family oxidoreductase [Melghirimyces profundicolus]PTX53893.1 NADP-dependent 3-hydroxy acid dehydrogenase YdfG [Melghirimyces profundicolus]